VRALFTIPSDPRPRRVVGRLTDLAGSPRLRVLIEGRQTLAAHLGGEAGQFALDLPATTSPLALAVEVEQGPEGQGAGASLSQLLVVPRAPRLHRIRLGGVSATSVAAMDGVVRSGGDRLAVGRDGELRIATPAVIPARARSFRLVSGLVDGGEPAQLSVSARFRALDGSWTVPLFERREIARRGAGRTPLDVVIVEIPELDEQRIGVLELELVGLAGTGYYVDSATLDR
jgi:hypothetical protein